jgi:hypothetical protein
MKNQGRCIQTTPENELTHMSSSLTNSNHPSFLNPLLSRQTQQKSGRFKRMTHRQCNMVNNHYCPRKESFWVGAKQDQLDA